MQSHAILMSNKVGSLISYFECNDFHVNDTSKCRCLPTEKLAKLIWRGHRCRFQRFVAKTVPSQASLNKFEATTNIPGLLFNWDEYTRDSDAWLFRLALLSFQCGNRKRRTCERMVILVTKPEIFRGNRDKLVKLCLTQKRNITEQSKNKWKKY